MKSLHTVAIAALLSLATLAHAQTPPAAAASAAAAEWKYKTRRLNAAEVDALLAQPDKLLVLDLRRPDELIKYGSFPVFLNIQNNQLEKQLGYLPRDRVILTVSNHAQRAGRAGDLLAEKGYKVVGATGSEDYENEGGKAVAHIQPPQPRAAAQGGANVAAAGQP
ncbi:rhodanese-like domain-containing protein [Roseateles cellulosilyticus]|uniref:Rhodanese-like domain-containing protein n=1 Tax=Pelomonas cellulosilytica TaxID=2906762 RepID=A0ABS8XT29_9BURK|nr:rhodanese-like domain-containing protein [Pelomonas sp. P8]MCE4553996.1 rhodanese-like domain-containing protein [Pelomonas sp. P8]